MIKTIILVLAISSIAIAQSAEPAPYEDPWTKDPVNGKCNKGEEMSKVISDKDGREYAMCMQIKYHGDNSQCTPPPNFENTKLAAYPVRYGDGWMERACVVECSDDMNKCPGNSTCLA